MKTVDSTDSVKMKTCIYEMVSMIKREQQMLSCVNIGVFCRDMLHNNKYYESLYGSKDKVQVYPGKTTNGLYFINNWWQSNSCSTFRHSSSDWANSGHVGQ